jgi:site-specific recombinase XerC
LTLIAAAKTIRDKAIIALLTESGMRLSELASITMAHIDWEKRIIRVLGKGNKEDCAPFGALSADYLRAWLHTYTPNGNIWGVDNMASGTNTNRIVVFRKP